MTLYAQIKDQTVHQKQELYSLPIIQAALKGDITTQLYIDFLSQAYHHVKHTVPLLMACGARLSSDLEWLREAMAEYIEEELGHQEWILNDIKAAGGDPERVRNSQPGLHTDIMVSYAYDTIARKNPVGFLGMVYVLEHTSTELATGAANTLKRKLCLPDAAFSYLFSHGSLDLEHIAFYEKLVNRLERPEDHQAVIESARIFYTLYGNVFNALGSANRQTIAA